MINLKFISIILIEMNRASFFINNKALFGSYPSQDGVKELEQYGVRCFVDLTCSNEKGIEKYNTEYIYINYPIIDRRCPTNWRTFSQLVIKVADIIKNLNSDEKVYVHCRGGHGRSGVLVACLLCYLYKIHPADAISKTTKYHSKRKEMKEKWRKIGSPQTRSQKHFVTKFFEPLYIYNNYSSYFSTQFNNDTELSVSIPGIGKFPTATAAFYSYKDQSNIEYINNLKKCDNINEITKIYERCSGSTDWEYVKESVMYKVLQYKFDQHETILLYLLDTGLRPIICKSNDLFWGKMDNNGKNVLGKLIYKLRNKYYKNLAT